VEAKDIMKARIDLMHATPGVIQAMLGLERQVRQAGFDHRLLDLVRMRASQINGCAYCLDMHSKDARANGETEQRLYGLDAWRETPYYSARERAALEWTEALTLVSETRVPDDVYERVREQFSRAGAVPRGRAGAPEPGDRGDQRLEPAQHRCADGAGRLRGREPREVARGGVIAHTSRGVPLRRRRRRIR
jgi:AhpD family alkylhydroperoxidase